jgi:hypothetical protein
MCLEEMKQTLTVNDHPLKLEEVVNGVVHPETTETITEWKKLIDDPLLRDCWNPRQWIYKDWAFAQD